MLRAEFSIETPEEYSGMSYSGVQKNYSFEFMNATRRIKSGANEVYRANIWLRRNLVAPETYYRIRMTIIILRN